MVPREELSQRSRRDWGWGSRTSGKQGLSAPRGDRPLPGTVQACVWGSSESTTWWIVTPTAAGNAQLFKVVLMPGSESLLCREPGFPPALFTLWFQGNPLSQGACLGRFFSPNIGVSSVTRPCLRDLFLISLLSVQVVATQGTGTAALSWWDTGYNLCLPKLMIHGIAPRRPGEVRALPFLGHEGALRQRELPLLLQSHFTLLFPVPCFSVTRSPLSSPHSDPSRPSLIQCCCIYF